MTSETTNPTIGAICDAYLEVKKNPFSYRKCRHPENLASSLKRIRREWGQTPIDEFNKGSTARVEDAFAKWRAEGTQTGTCRKALSILKAACNLAVKRELIRRDQLPIFDLPPAGPPRERVVDPKNELPALLHEAKHGKTPYHIWLQTQLLLRLGCRVGALLALRWEHIDFDNRLILLRETQSAEDRATNKKKRENQPMDQELFDILTEAKARAKSNAVIEWRGKPVSRTYAGQKALYRRAGLENLTRHDLRRSSATFVYNGLEGNVEAAARHIADTKEMAERVYIQKAAEVKLPGIEAIGKVMREASV